MSGQFSVQNFVASGTATHTYNHPESWSLMENFYFCCSGVATPKVQMGHFHRSFGPLRVGSKTPILSLRDSDSDPPKQSMQKLSRHRVRHSFFVAMLSDQFLVYLLHGNFSSGTTHIPLTTMHTTVVYFCAWLKILSCNFGLIT